MHRPAEPPGQALCRVSRQRRRLSPIMGALRWSSPNIHDTFFPYNRQRPHQNLGCRIPTVVDDEAMSA